MPFKKWKAFLFWTKYQPCVVKIRIQMSLFYYLSGHLSVLDSRVALSLPDCTAHQVSLTFLQWCSDWSAQMLFSYFWMEIKRPPKCKALAPANAVWADVFTVNIFFVVGWPADGLPAARQAAGQPVQCSPPPKDAGPSPHWYSGHWTG